MFKSFFRKIISTLLRWEARLVLIKYRPKIVAVTGSVGKTTTKDAVYHLLNHFYPTGRSQKSYNSDLGLPLTILGCDSAGRRPAGWIKNLLEGLVLVFWPNHYPKWLVLEVGADRPGDIASIIAWLRPDMAILTALPEVPAHIEFFATAEAVAREKSFLLAAIKKKGIAILNHDDERIAGVKKSLANHWAERQIRILSYGFGGGDVRASHDHLIAGADGEMWPRGLSFKINYGSNSIPLSIPAILAREQAQAVLAALAVGQALELSWLKMTEAMTTFVPPPGRLRSLPGIKNTLLIDDTYNSSPAALVAALELVKKIPVTGRRIVVLGDMLELGTQTMAAHRAAGVAAAAVADFLITVGPRAKFIAEAADKKRFGKRKMKHFDEPNEVGQFLQNFLQPGDLVLFKASQAVRLERAVLEVMAEPARRAELLVRQDRDWLNR
ncbi:MAG: Mur ligase family protein [Patescibacteria group bacterium]